MVPVFNKLPMDSGDFQETPSNRLMEPRVGFIHSLNIHQLPALVSLKDHKMLRFLHYLFLAINIRLGLSGYQSDRNCGMFGAE